MPTNLFFGLHEDKREKIINVAIAEFALYDYATSSTNRIVKESAISKGSLFKYFNNKEDLYFYLLDRVTKELISSIEEKIDQLPQDIFERIIMYSELEFTWYILNPEKYQLILKAFAKSDVEIYQKTVERYNCEGQNIFYKLLADSYTEQFGGNKEVITNILKWCLKGFNQEFIDRVKLQNSNDIDTIRNDYVKNLSEYLGVLKGGILNDL